MDGNTSEIIHVEKLIHFSYEKLTQEGIEPAILASLQYFSRHPTQHLFCNQDTFEIAITSLMIFAYNSSKQLKLFEEHLEALLSTCPDCSKRYPFVCDELYQRLTDKFKFETNVVKELKQIIEKSTRSRMVTYLNNLVAHLPSQEPSILTCLICVQNELFNSIWLFSDNKISDRLKKLFNISFYSAQFMSLDFAPAFILLLFNNDRLLRAKGKEWFQSSDKIISELEYRQPVVINCIEKIISEIPPADNQRRKEFWYNFSLLLSRLDSKSYQIPFSSQLPYKNLAEFVAHNLCFKTQHSLPAILKVFYQVLYNDASGFFDLISASPEILVQEISKQPGFIEPLSYSLIAPTSKCSYAQQPTDILLWLYSFSKDSPERLELLGKRILPLVATIFEKIKKTSGSYIVLAIFFDILRECMDVDVEQRAPFVAKEKILKLSQYRLMCDNLAFFIIDIYNPKKNTSVQIAILEIIEHCIFLDVLCGTPGPVEENVEILTNSNSLWKEVNNLNKFDLRISIKILTAITHVVFIVRPPSQNKDQPHIMPQGKASEITVSNAIASLKKIVEIPSTVFVKVLDNNKCFLSLILNLYSADPEISKLSGILVNKLVGGSNINDTFSKLLNTCFIRMMRCFNSSIRSLYLANVFSPISQFVVNGSIFLKNLFLVNDAVQKFASLKTNENNELYLFWYNTWSLLTIAFGDTPQLTQIYRNDFMITFMENSMNFAGLLIDNFENFRQNLPKSLATPEFVLQKLLSPVVNGIAEMICLLRLKDSSLTMICYGAVMSVLKLVNLYHFRSDKLYYIYMTVYNMAIKAKGSGNILKPEQLSSLLVATSLYTQTTADLVVQNPKGNKDLNISKFLEKMQNEDKAVKEILAEKVKKNVNAEKTTTELNRAEKGTGEKSVVKTTASEIVTTKDDTAGIVAPAENTTAKKPRIVVREEIANSAAVESTASSANACAAQSEESLVQKAPACSVTQKPAGGSETTTTPTTITVNTASVNTNVFPPPVLPKKPRNIDTSVFAPVDPTSLAQLNLIIPSPTTTSADKSNLAQPAPIIPASAESTDNSVPVSAESTINKSAPASSIKQVLPHRPSSPKLRSTKQRSPSQDKPSLQYQSRTNSVSSTNTTAINFPSLALKDFASRIHETKTILYRPEPPSANGFFKRVLQWDYCADTLGPVIQSTQEMVLFPALSIPRYISTVHDYFDIHEPMILKECWNQIRRDKVDCLKRSFKVVVTDKDYFPRASSGIRGIVSSDQFDELALTKSDLLLLTGTVGNSSYCLAKITFFNYAAKEVEVKFMIENPSTAISNMLVIGSELTAFQVTNLEKLENEYNAIANLESFPLWKDLLNKRLIKPIEPPAHFVKTICDRFDLSSLQANALINCHKDNGFSLVNG
jgi:high-affinity Fe2+/Pb2+ permease